MSWMSDGYTLLLDTSRNRQALIEVTPVQEWLAPFPGGSLPEHWMPQPNLGGDWRIDPADGTLVGEVSKEDASILWCDRWLEGDHMIEFLASTRPPHDNDISALWEGSGTWGEGDDEYCTIGGLGGWWQGYSGIEARGGSRSVTKTGALVVGQIYKTAAGRVTSVHAGADGQSTSRSQDFLFVNGKLVQQITGAAPNDAGAEDRSLRPLRQKSRVAITTLNSAIKIYGMRIST